ncbi:hypothetical protein ACKUB1_12070 [Methanospirillum stamsii]|uniref:Uncharacterized protein n=1 Tax=Methanospirillum stamsii TaxID=1277351 RepID=A0A2V2N5A6_9EURY|nr:hypothetical protein [Methanospirillum stamsii]PWR70453.1 hypothetical protein DLD82_15375 [Methanospirillum stamsii]
MKDNRYVSPPGALKFTKKKITVSEKDMAEAEEVFDTITDNMNATSIDDNTLDIIRMRKKNQSSNPAFSHH